MQRVCMYCGARFGVDDKHDCKAQLNELELDMIPVVISMTFCDHYCCKMTPTVCRAKSLIRALKDFDYELHKKEVTEE